MVEIQVSDLNECLPLEVGTAILHQHFHRLFMPPLEGSMQIRLASPASRTSRLALMTVFQFHGRPHGVFDLRTDRRHQPPGLAAKSLSELKMHSIHP